MGSPETTWGEKHKFQLLLVGIGFFVYFNSLFGAFIWDDIAQIQNNSLIKSLANLLTLFLGGTYAPQNGLTGTGAYYRPVMSFIFSTIYSLSGAQPFLFHLTQTTIHITNSIIIFLIFKKFVKEQLALILAIIFLVHPLNVEAVSYISALGEPLFVFFGLVALYLFQKKGSLKQATFVGIFLLCSLFAKETGVVFLIVLFAYYLIVARKQWIPLIVIALTTIPFIFYLFMRFIVARVQIERIPDVPMMTAPLADRIYTMPAMFWLYIKTFFFPKDIFILQLWSIPGFAKQFYIPLILSMILLLGIMSLGIWIWKTNKHNLSAFIFFAIWFLVGVGLHMQLVPLDFTVADRYFYFAMIGALGLIGISLSSIKRVPLQLEYVGITCIILIIAILSLRTIIRNTNWVNGLSLYGHDLQYKQNDRIQNALAIELITAGRYSEADKHLQELLVRNPRESALYANLAGSYEIQGKLKQAKEIYKRGLIVDDSGAIYINLARMLIQREANFFEARNISTQGLEKFPKNVDLWIIKVIAEYKLGDKQNALKDAEKVKELLPNSTTEKLYNDILNNQPL